MGKRGAEEVPDGSSGKVSGVYVGRRFLHCGMQGGAGPGNEGTADTDRLQQGGG